MRRLAMAGILAHVALGGPGATHTGALKTKHFEIRYRPASRAGASVERTGSAVERDLARINGLLAIQEQGPFKLFLYDDIPELHAITKTEGNAGFSSGDAIHIPFDNDQTRFHELVHVVAYKLPKSGAELRSLFFAEGLANGLMEYVHGVHVHAVAAFEKRKGKLPSLKEMTGAKDFYTWMRAHAGLNAYDLAASWFRFLVDEHGVAKVKRYYTGTPAKDAFGDALDKLEKAWHKRLDAYGLRPEVETLLKQRAGERVRFDVYALDPDQRLPKEILGKPSDWKDVTGEKLRPGKGDWSAKDGVVTGKSADGSWSWCELGTKKYKNCAVRAVVRPRCGAVELRLGETCRAMHVQNGTFVYMREKGVAANNTVGLQSAKRVDLLLVRRGGMVEVWIDGFKVVTGRAGNDAAKVGLGVAGGEAAFEKVRVRRLR